MPGQQSQLKNKMGVAYRKILLLIPMSLGFCLMAQTQTGKDTLKVGVNDEQIDFLLPKDSLFEKEIVFEDSGRRYIIRVQGIPKTHTPPKLRVVNPTPAADKFEAPLKRKKMRNLFADASIGITYPVGATGNIVTKTSGFSFAADRVYLSEFNNQKFKPGIDLRLNLYQVSKKLNNNWWYKRSIQFNYYFFNSYSTVYSSEYTAKSDGNNTMVADSLVYSTSSATDITYHRFRLLFPYMFEKVMTLNNGKQFAYSLGVAFSMNLVTYREIKQGYAMWGFNYNFNPGEALVNAIVPMASVRYHRLAWYGQLKYNPVSNINLITNPQHWLFQSGVTFNLY